MFAQMNHNDGLKIHSIIRDLLMFYGKVKKTTKISLFEHQKINPIQFYFIPK